MARSGHLAALGAAGALALLVAGTAHAADPKPQKAARAQAPASAAAEPAVTTGERSMGTAELARAGRAVESVPATTIYQSRLPDGTLELSDRPPASGASDVAQRNYSLPQDGAARQRALAEREYWKKQADAFNVRQAQRDREYEQARRERAAPPVTTIEPVRRYANPWGWQGPVYGGVPVVGGPVAGGGGSAYTSSPGAAQGRSGGFIGSGFSTAR